MNDAALIALALEKLLPLLAEFKLDVIQRALDTQKPQPLDDTVRGDVEAEVDVAFDRARRNAADIVPPSDPPPAPTDPAPPPDTDP